MEQTYFRWRREYGGLQVDQARRLKELEQENTKLKRDGEPEPGQSGTEGPRLGKLLSPERRRIATTHAQGEAWVDGAAGVPVGQPATRHAALSSVTARRRRCTHAGDHPACQPVRQLWVAPDHGVAEASWLAGWQGPRRVYLASRRAEGTAEAEATRPVVAQ